MEKNTPKFFKDEFRGVIGFLQRPQAVWILSTASVFAKFPSLADFSAPRFSNTGLPARSSIHLLQTILKSGVLQSLRPIFPNKKHYINKIPIYQPI
ncbi:hypothetical protein [Neisseria iguanae]|uniref:Uncharacterized protein n=1 Tax=Neisseria iguanae TaxID=90242 RepID=A0A2P7TXK9_9NEIS|nr:hypothetical protein [Neisseria iguanae]PSJ79393.1 hypothetical protein C7N83_12445 [Neisseria iguanae]